MDGLTVYRYMAAWVRLHSVTPVTSEQELIDCFAVLPPPEVTLEQFAVKVGAQPGPLPEAPKAETPQERSARLGKQTVGLVAAFAGKNDDVKNRLQDMLVEQRRKLEDAPVAP